MRISEDCGRLGLELIELVENMDALDGGEVAELLTGWIRRRSEVVNSLF